jgi:Zn-finger nucleic acid-binding protein
MKRCEEITLDFEKSKFQKLTLNERVAQRMHLGMCSKCKRYLKDSKTLDKLLAKCAKDTSNLHVFSQTEKTNLKIRLKNQA